MDAIKICINANGKSRIFYTDIASNYKIFLNKCEDEFANVETMFKYWIDDDGDKVEINGEHSYKMFLKLSPKNRIFIESEDIVNETPIRKQETTPINSGKPFNNDGNDGGDKCKNSVHRGVSCDQCNMLPIIGFRYKCLECPNFDLCMICENKNYHDHHKMIRIPAPEIKRRNSSNIGSNRFPTAAENFNDFAINIDIPIKHQGKEKTDRSERRSKRHHKRCSDGGSAGGNIHQIGTNVLSNLFQMMQGMAGNTTPNNTTNKSEDDNKKDEKIFEKNESSPKKQSGSSTPQKQEPPQQQQKSSQNSNEKTEYDPETIKAGAEVLNNFGKMFGKFLDPINIGVNVGVCPFGATATSTTFTNRASTNTTDTPTTASATTTENENKYNEQTTENTNVSFNDTTNENNSTEIPMKSQNKININLPETENITETVIIEDVPELPNNFNNWKSTDGAVGGLIETEIIPIIDEKPIEKPLLIEKQNSQEDIGWTLIDNEKSIINNNDDVVVPPTSQSPNDSIKSINNKLESEPNSPPKQTQFDYAQLSKTLEKHLIEEEEQRKKSVPINITYHKKPHVNNAVIAMIAMGFSNEGKWLTHLLESVDGDISQALDLLKPAK